MLNFRGKDPMFHQICLQCLSTVIQIKKSKSKEKQFENTPVLLGFMYTHKVSNGIQLYDTSWFCCGLLTDDVEHLPNIFLK